MPAKDDRTARLERVAQALEAFVEGERASGSRDGFLLLFARGNSQRLEVISNIERSAAVQLATEFVAANTPGSRDIN